MTTESHLLILALVFGFYAAWNIGANDVANAMGTSVGSKALTLRQAVILAAIFEFLGAVLFGANVSETLEKGLVDPEVFILRPITFVNGMLAALLATGLWLQFASFCGLPVSTTHAIVGAIVGFGAVVGGIDSVLWGNVVTIAVSWIASPLLGGIIAYILFAVIKQQIFYQPCPLEATKKLLPFIAGMVTLVLSLSMTYRVISPDRSGSAKIVACLVLSGVVSLIASCLVKRIKTPELKNPEFYWTEKIFGYLQISSACLMAFAHGSNDVSNAIGPMAAITTTLQHHLSENSSFPTWALMLGGVGIVTGLATWGWRVIETIGRRITELTPSRGFCAEFGAALTILAASFFGFPISTTHTLVGAVFGIGLAGGLASLNIKTIRDILVSWFVTIPAGAVLSILCYHVLALIFS